MFFIRIKRRTIHLRYHHVGRVSRATISLHFWFSDWNLKSTKKTSPFDKRHPSIETRESSDLFHPTRTAKLYSDNLTPFKSHVRSRTKRSRSAPRALVLEGADFTEGFTAKVRLRKRSRNHRAR